MAFTTTPQDIIDDAEEILQDTGNDFWTAAELLQAVNNGCKEICQYKPDTYIVTTSFVLVAGIVQTIPDAGFYLQDVVCNMGTNGSTLGNKIELIDRKIMDKLNPSWPTVTEAATAIYWMFDERYPRNFLVYPAQPAVSPGYVQAMYSAAPAEVAVDAKILIPDVNRPALLQYVLYTAHLKESDRTGQNAQKAAGYYQAFLNAIGVRHDREKIEDPNTK